MIANRSISKLISRKLTELSFVAKIALDDARTGFGIESSDELAIAIQNAESLYKNLLELKKTCK